MNYFIEVFYLVGFLEDYRAAYAVVFLPKKTTCCHLPPLTELASLWIVRSYQCIFVVFLA